MEKKKFSGFNRTPSEAKKNIARGKKVTIFPSNSFLASDNNVQRGST